MPIIYTGALEKRLKKKGSLTCYLLTTKHEYFKKLGFGDNAPLPDIKICNLPVIKRLRWYCNCGREAFRASSLETAIVNILHSFEPQFDDAQKKALSKEFVRYQTLAQKNNTRRNDERRKEIEADVRTLFRQDFF